MERVMGIEPTYQAWEARVLPLNYTRSLRLAFCKALRLQSIPALILIREPAFEASFPLDAGRGLG